MIERIDTSALEGHNEELEPVHFMRTIFVPRAKVTATISLSSHTIGIRLVGDRYQMGTVQTVIRKAGFASGPNSSDEIPLADDWWRNGITIDKCLWVTFQLTAVVGRAIALCSLSFHQTPTAQRFERAPLRPVAVVGDRTSGAIRAVHYFDAMEGARVPSERLVTQAIRKCSAEDLKVEPRSLDVAFRDDPAFRLKPGARLDRKSGQVKLIEQPSGGGGSWIDWRRS